MKISRILSLAGILAAALAVASCTVRPMTPGPVPPAPGHRPPHSWQAPGDPHHPAHKPARPHHGPETPPPGHDKPRKHDKKKAPKHRPAPRSGNHVSVRLTW